MSKAKIITIANQKGGVAKTSTASALAAGLRRKGFRVLGIDMDPQGSFSVGSGATVNGDTYTILEVMKGSATPAQAIQKLDCYDIIPADIQLSGYEQELISTTFGRDVRLKTGIASLLVLPSYDYVVIDTGPSLSMLTINSLAASDEVIIPMAAEAFSANGLELLYSTIQNVKNFCGNPGLTISGILFANIEARTNNSQAIREATVQYAKAHNIRVFKTFIRKCVVQGESQTNRMDIYSYDSKSNAAADYAAFVEEYLEGESDNG